MLASYSLRTGNRLSEHQAKVPRDDTAIRDPVWSLGESHNHRQWIAQGSAGEADHVRNVLSNLGQEYPRPAARSENQL